MTPKLRDPDLRRGRRTHNAVDTIASRMWLDQIDGGDKIFYTTGRLASEIVIKAAQMAILSSFALGPHPDGLRDRAEGRHHDDRSRDEQAFPSVHRRGALSRRERMTDSAGAAKRTGAACAAACASSPASRPASSRIVIAKLPARARRGLRHLGRLHGAAGECHCGRRRSRRLRILAGDLPQVLSRVRHQAVLRGRQMAGRDARATRGVRRSRRPRAAGHAFYKEHAAWLPELKAPPTS